jgi:SWI/SNF-related matrix-associated actin-dependent regulator 1 of chromatin subfamily A
MQLYEHQVSGAAWLAARDRAMLWDEQGLGKTVTAIVAADAAGCKRVLVCCPSVVLWNWAREWAAWSPDRSVQVVDAGDLTIGGDSVAIVTHDLLRSPRIFAQLRGAGFDLAVIDEAHNFRNREAARSRRLWGVRSKQVPSVLDGIPRRWTLTGTPMPNNASELWTCLWGMWPAEFEGFFTFRSRYCELAHSDYTPDRLKVVGNKNVGELRDKLAGKYLRRLKADCLSLPERRFEQVVVGTGRMPPALAAANAAVRALWDGAVAQGRELAGLAESLEFATWRRLSGMAKAAASAEMLAAELDAGAMAKVVVFVHHRDVLTEVVARLKGFGVRWISGDLSGKQRAEAVLDFQQEGGPRVIVCNIVAGGTGVTLTAATEAVFVELSWVPGENAQAADRIHRIGQSGKTRVRFLALAGTIDEAITATLRMKTAMVSEVLSRG